MEQTIQRIIKNPNFHNVYVRGCNYRTMACCGKELFTVTCSKDDENIFHYFHSEDGYGFSVNAPLLFDEESPEILQGVIARNPAVKDGEMSVISWGIIADHIKADCKPHICSDTKVVFEHNEEVFVLSPDGLEMVVNNKPRKRVQLRGLQPVQFDLVHNMIF